MPAVLVSMTFVAKKIQTSHYQWRNWWHGKTEIQITSWNQNLGSNLFSCCKKFEHIIQIGKYKDMTVRKRKTTYKCGSNRRWEFGRFKKVLWNTESSLCSDWPERNYFCEIQNRIQFVFSLAGEKILLWNTNQNQVCVAGENASKGPQNAVKWPYQGQVAVPDGRYKTTDHDKSEIGSKVFGIIGQTLSNKNMAYQLLNWVGSLPALSHKCW